MNNFIRRIRRLQEQIGTQRFYVRLIYSDGTESVVGGLDAVIEILQDSSIVDIKCDSETDQSLFSELLKAEQEYGGNFDDLIEL